MVSRALSLQIGPSAGGEAAKIIRLAGVHHTNHDSGGSNFLAALCYRICSRILALRAYLSPIKILFEANKNDNLYCIRIKELIWYLHLTMIFLQGGAVRCQNLLLWSWFPGIFLLSHFLDILGGKLEIPKIEIRIQTSFRPKNLFVNVVWHGGAKI